MSEKLETVAWIGEIAVVMRDALAALSAAGQAGKGGE